MSGPMSPADRAADQFRLIPAHVEPLRRTAGIGFCFGFALTLAFAGDTKEQSTDVSRFASGLAYLQLMIWRGLMSLAFCIRIMGLLSPPRAAIALGAGLSLFFA